ncbi:hypothetical protein Taro_015456 [Colocasia esculenta]|uniref:RNase H type-1 domain-containing protein n=1 Tax=Colocasia esculenta TaxID=4460 RepID=A0A843ULB4_COLES|nr:hypothetical protein [Colocasia esculenta]
MGKKTKKKLSIAAFAHYYGIGNSLQAETRALCDGLRFAKSLGVRLSHIQSDSLSLVNLLNQDRCISWPSLKW